MGEKRRFSSVVAVCFTINYVTGTGFLTLPWAFHIGGIILSTFTMVIILIISNTTKNYILESMALAERLAELEETSGIREGVIAEESSTFLRSSGETGGMEYGSNFSYLGASTDGIGLKATFSDYDNHDNLAHDGRIQSQSAEGVLIIKDRKFEMTQLCHIYLGRFGEKTYIASIGLDIFGTLWGFTIVFASSLARTVPITNDSRQDYRIYAAIFAALVVPLSCLELNEQVIFQVIYTACRALVLLLMILTSLIAFADSKLGGSLVYFYDVAEAGDGGTHKFSFSPFQMFSILVYTFVFHHGIGVVSEAAADRKKLGIIFLSAILISGAFFWLLSFSVAIYFGDSVEQCASLNWHTFVGGTGARNDDDGTWINVEVWARAISIFVVCFPAVNVISAFPLHAIALGNNLMAAVFGETVHEAERNRKLVVLFRLISTLPPLLGALFISDLGYVTAWAGIFVCAIAFPIPATMYLSAVRLAKKRRIEFNTFYNGFGSTASCAHAVIIFSLFAMGSIVITLILG